MDERCKSVLVWTMVFGILFLINMNLKGLSAINLEEVKVSDRYVRLDVGDMFTFSLKAKVGDELIEILDPEIRCDVSEGYRLLENNTVVFDRFGVYLFEIGTDGMYESVRVDVGNSALLTEGTFRVYTRTGEYDSQMYYIDEDGTRYILGYNGGYRLPERSGTIFLQKSRGGRIFRTPVAEYSKNVLSSSLDDFVNVERNILRLDVEGDRLL